MKIGIIREGKVPVDTRVALTPQQCKEVMEKYPFVAIKVQKSENRCYKDQEYEALGIELTEQVEDCDILLGIKEVPINNLIADKTYLFFSHTIKKQTYNRKLLQNILQKKIHLIDYETLTEASGNRVIAFGRYAGLVGAYNGVMAYGKRFGLFELKPAHQCFDMKEMWQELHKVSLPSVKIALTGGGRVSQGAMETLDGMGIRKVSPEEYLEKTFKEAVYTQLDPEHYAQVKDASKPFDTADFYQHPENYASHFARFAEVTDLLIAAAYWDPHAPVLFTREEAKKENFRIKVVADITCDIDGSVASTRQPSTIQEPLYDYNPATEKVEAPLSNPGNITVMAVDNLPNELPRDASESFGRQLIDNVLNGLLVEDSEEMIARASIAKSGSLTQKYNYLQDFVEVVEE
ncbi:NAD(P)-dependent oxidoreductase [Rapidithrix thailandica]|uniref:Saccharopine dehydrogenase [NAD(+), L-lysine-forming] n=1 Tax=Rapidithrix thailandica TaxID=413964 RepID=A0AAW9S6E5_9BACT